jgi:hypothetical protein
MQESVKQQQHSRSNLPHSGALDFTSYGQTMRAGTAPRNSLDTVCAQLQVARLCTAAETSERGMCQLATPHEVSAVLLNRSINTGTPRLYRTARVARVTILSGTRPPLLLLLSDVT